MGTRPEINNQVAQLVDNLFTRKRRLDGDEYSYAELAHASGGQFSGTYFAKLRRGEIKNPGRDGLLFLCQFFHVPASYFFPELDTQERYEPSDEERINAALRSSSLPIEAQEHLQGLVKVLLDQCQNEVV